VIFFCLEFFYKGCEKVTEATFQDQKFKKKEEEDEKG
jgi:hypothetical protein